jgi:hypothetical protein
MPSAPGAHRFTWDLDKTYLRTEFETVRGLLRAAFEEAEDKVAFPGAAKLLQAIRREPGRTLHILSGSPRQMRRTLEEKLSLDGIMWDRFELKPNLENLLRGRFRAVRDQVGYKLPALLRWRARGPVDVDETLVGDDAEADAFVYSLYADLIAGRVRRAELERVLDLAECHDEARERVREALNRVVLRDGVRRILIHLDRRTPPARLAAYGPRLVPVHNYFEMALVLHSDGRLADRAVVEVAKELAGTAGYGTAALVNALDGLVRRRHLDPAVAAAQAQLLALAFGGTRWTREVARLAGSARRRRPAPPAGKGPPDYAALYRQTGGRSIGV